MAAKLLIDTHILRWAAPDEANDNLDPAQSVIGVTMAQLAAARAYAVDAGAPAPGGDTRTRTALALARAGSPSPAAISSAAVGDCRDAELAAAETAERIGWISVLQMLHRLGSFFSARA